MESQAASGITERFIGRRDKHKDGAKEFRLSKADIGGPLPNELNTSSEKIESSGSQSVVFRFVRIQKNERGYGLTVSGDNPVYVQSVKENGAAQMAGVRQGDRIVKVNGTNVTDSNHVEVVKLIKAENHVTLTLISPSSNQEENSPSPIIPDLPRPPMPAVRPPSALIQDSAFYDEKVNTIKKMLDQEKVEVERIKEEYARDPNNKLLESLRSAQKLQQDLEKQLWKAESTRPSEDVSLPIKNLNHIPVTSISDVSETMVGGLDLALNEKQRESPKPSQQINIMNFDDEELAVESHSHHNHGPFLDYNQLKTKPAHAAVFLNYVFNSHDPSHLFLVLMVDIYRQISTVKEMFKFSDVIIKTYLSENAPLKVHMDEGIVQSIIENAQSRGLSEEALRSVFDPANQHALKTVKSQLQQYCSKREQGLSFCYGEEKVSGFLDHPQEVKVVEDVVNPLIQDLTQLLPGADEVTSSKITSKIEALEKLLTFWTGKKKNKIGSRFGSILRPNRPMGPTNRPKSSASVESIFEFEPSKRISMQGKKITQKFTKKQRPTKEPNSASAVASALPIIHPHSHQDQHGNDSSHSIGIKSRESLTVDGLLDSRSVDSRTGSVREQRNERNRGSVLDVVNIEATDSESRNDGDVSDAVSGVSEDSLSQFLSLHPELDVDPETSWSATAPPQVIKQIGKKECKRQEIINELLQTEIHHVRDLQILSVLFYQRMVTEAGLDQDELHTIFPNLYEILEIHQKLKKGLIDIKKRDGTVIKEIGPVLSQMFVGAPGEKFRHACAKYCGNQSAALEFIKEKCKRDQKFNTFIQSIERHPICRRLQLKDFIPVEFQRLTKYPLLLENIIKNTKKNEDSILPQVSTESKKILQHVDKAIKDSEDFQKVVEIQKTLDTSALGKVNHPIAQEYKNINLTERKLVHQGPLIWRITQSEKKKSVGLHCVLFEDIMVLLQKQEDKYVLKCHTNATAPNQKASVQPPILKLSKVYVRNVATDKRAFYVISDSEFGAQIYDLVASTVHEMQEWFKLVSLSMEIAKNTPGQSQHAPTPPLHRNTFRPVEAAESESAERTADSPRTSTVIIEDDEAGVSIEESDIFTKLQTKDEVINTALSEKHDLLAVHAGLDPQELDSVLEMTLQDSLPDSISIVLHLLSLSDKLTSITNEALSPDTEFLQPLSPHLLMPLLETKTEASPLSAGLASSSGWENPISPSDKKTIVQTGATKTSDQNDKTITSPSLTNSAAEFSDNEKDKNSSLELNVASDYETASESPSPVSDGENVNSECGQSEHEAISTPVPDDQSEQQSSGVIIEAEESYGPNSDSYLDKVTFGSDNDLTSEVLTPLPSDSQDLLDFGGHVILPEETKSTLPTPRAESKSSLVGKTNPLNLTKMLKTQAIMHSQLIKLLEILRTSEVERQQDLRRDGVENESPRETESDSVEQAVQNSQNKPEEEPIATISEDDNTDDASPDLSGK